MEGDQSGIQVNIPSQAAVLAGLCTASLPLKSGPRCVQALWVGHGTERLDG